MFAKLFASIYQGTLRGNTHGLVVFTNLLAHADAAGWADIHPRAIAEEVGLTVEQVTAAIRFLEAPDPESRSPDMEGRRIVRLDDHRAWGWKIVNHAKYRAIRDEGDRREQNRLAQERARRKRNADSQQSQPRQPMSAQAEAEAEAEAEAVLPPTGGSPLPADEKAEKVSKLPDCPQQKLLALWAKHLPGLTQPRTWEGQRKIHMRSRWAQAAAPSAYSPKGYKTEAEGLVWWDTFFAYIANDTTLPAGFSTGSRTWRPDLDWVLKPESFAKIVDGKYQK